MALAFVDWLAVCISSWSLFSLSLYSAALCWCLVHVDWRALVDWRWAKELIGGALARCRAALLQWQSDDESHIDAAVHNLVSQRKRDFVRRAILVISPVVALGDLFLMCRAVGLMQVEQQEARHPRETHLIVSAGTLVVTALFIFRREQPTKGILVAFHLVGSGSLLLKLYLCGTGLDLLFDRTALAIRVAFALSLCDIKLTIFCNSLYVALMMYKFSEFSEKDENIAQLGFANQFYQELFIFIGLVVCHMVLSWRLEAEARTTIDAKMSTKFIAGLRKLLKTRYDVVVELDDQLMLTDDAKDLAGVLLHGPHRSLKGSLFTDLMSHDADKEVFASQVTMQSVDSESQCCAIPHVFHMRDSCTNVLRMEMWHTRLEDIDSRLRHLIGIKELANEGHAGTVSQPADMPLRRPPRTPRARRPTSGVDVSDEEQPRQGQISENPMQQRAPQGQGRPQDHGSHGEDSEGSSISPAPSERSHRRMVEGFGLTSALAQRASILHTLTAWNIARRPAGCCSYHDLIREATNTAKWLARSQCQQVDSIHSQAELWQCPTCGILAMSAAHANYDHTARVCYLCRDYRNAAEHLVEM